jgi:hypothetical protein
MQTGVSPCPTQGELGLMLSRPTENSTLHGRGSGAGEDYQPGDLDKDLVFGLHSMEMGWVVVVIIDRDRDPATNQNRGDHRLYSTN